MEKDKKISKFPKGFFTKIRPEAKETLDDAIPVEWVKRKAKKDKQILKSKNITSLN